MAELESLIKVRRHDIEQKQKALAALYKQSQDLKDMRDEIETQLAIETEKSKEMGAEMLSYFGPYAKASRKKIEHIDYQRQQLENHIRMAQDAMRDAFAEMKKIEIIDERRKEEELAALEKKLSAELDEIAINGFRRNTEEP